jgi:tetratricopeptide (TPR) repeat protein
LKSVPLILTVFIFAFAQAQDTPDFLFNKGYNYLLIDKEEAIHYFDLCLERDNDYVAAYQFRGLAHFKLGHYLAALSDFDRALEINPNLTLIHMYKGYTHQQLGDHDLALEDFQAYVTGKKELSSIDYKVLGKARLQQGDITGAIASFEEALADEPGESQHYYHYLALFEARKLDLALEQLNKAIQYNDRFYGYYLHRGKTLTLQGNFDLAIADFSRALTLSPEVADAYYLRGAVLDTLNRHNEAIKDFTSAIRLNPADGTYYSKRGNAKFAIGKRNAACLDWTIAGKFGYYEDFDKIKTLCE